MKETMQERLQSIFDTDGMLWFVDDERNAENVISLDAALTAADEIIDELTKKHEAELKAQRYAAISECLGLINDKFYYDRVYELLNAGDA